MRLALSFVCGVSACLEHGVGTQCRKLIALSLCRCFVPLGRDAQSAGNRGFVTQLLNAMRLQAETLAPSTFLRSFLSSHEGWGAALPVLREDTLRQQRVGLGFEVRGPRALTGTSMAMEITMLIAIAVPFCSRGAGHVAGGGWRVLLTDPGMIVR